LITPFRTQRINRWYKTISVSDTFSILARISIITFQTLPIISPIPTVIINWKANSIKSKIPPYRTFRTHTIIPSSTSFIFGVNCVRNNTDSVNNLIALITALANSDFSVKILALWFDLATDTFRVEIIILRALSTHSFSPGLASVVVINYFHEFWVVDILLV